MHSSFTDIQNPHHDWLKSINPMRFCITYLQCYKHAVLQYSMIKNGLDRYNGQDKENTYIRLNSKKMTIKGS